MTGSVVTHAFAAFEELALEPDRPILIAVSGGADSTALLHLFHRYARAHCRGSRIVAVTIDHGLRPGSSAEAHQVAASCKAAGIDHRTLNWSHGKVGTGVQAKARAARYRLLADLARDLGVALVLTGHTADDQAETVAMRLARSTNEDGIGLAGIDAATLYARQVWSARPLLDLARADLRAWLAQQDIGFIDDPSNMDRRFERVRVRQRLASDPTECARLIETARSHAAARRDRATAAARCLDDRLVWHRSAQTIAMDPEHASRHDETAQLAALAGVLTVTGRLPHQPSEEQARAACTFCHTAANGQAFTIAGCRLHKTGGLALFEREPRNRRPAAHMSFDSLLVSADWPLAQALARLHDAQPYPPPPFTTIDINVTQQSHLGRICLAKRHLEPILN